MIHVLRAGRSLCRDMTGEPADWGPGQHWVSFTESRALEIVSCRECKVALAALRDETGRLTREYLVSVRDAAARFGTIEEPSVKAHIARLEAEVERRELAAAEARHREAMAAPWERP